MILVEQPPDHYYLQSGAVAAVLMIVFQHTISAVAGENVQLSSNDVLQLGDWIEMPDKNLSGEVTDIALHTITILQLGQYILPYPDQEFPHRDLVPTGSMFSSGRGGSCAVSPMISTRCVFSTRDALPRATIRVSEPSGDAA
ncbi:mechanosensitive ion channel family protein [Klebsiella pneumoniae]|nr:mechanosensitive ion channel family protein [Klebsiella pneumoniae]